MCGLLRVYALANGMCIRVRLACRCCSHASILKQSIHQQRGGGAGQHPVNAIGDGDVFPVNRTIHLSANSDPCTEYSECSSDDVPADEFQYCCCVARLHSMTTKRTTATAMMTTKTRLREAYDLPRAGWLARNAPKNPRRS